MRIISSGIWKGSQGKFFLLSGRNLNFMRHFLLCAHFTYFAQGLNSFCLSWIFVPLQNTGAVRLGITKQLWIIAYSWHSLEQVACVQAKERGALLGSSKLSVASRPTKFCWKWIPHELSKHDVWVFISLSKFMQQEWFPSCVVFSPIRSPLRSSSL